MNEGNSFENGGLVFCSGQVRCNSKDFSRNIQERNVPKEHFREYAERLNYLDLRSCSSDIKWTIYKAIIQYSWVKIK